MGTFGVNSLREFLSMSQQQRQRTAQEYLDDPVNSVEGRPQSVKTNTIDVNSLTELLCVSRQQRQRTSVETEYCEDSLNTEEEIDWNAKSTKEDNQHIHFDTEIFIEEIRKFYCLWNTFLLSYTDRNAKNNAW